MSEQSPPQLTEEQIRALEAELDRITVDDLLLQTIVSLLNLGARKAGLADPDAKTDLEQTRQAIDASRALLPLLEARHADKLGPVRDMLSQLQIAFAQGAAPPAGEPASGPVQSSGRLWTPNS